MDDSENIAAYSLLDLIKPEMKVCEIGVRSGQSSEAFLDRGCFLYMIDPWVSYDEIDDTNYHFEEDYIKTKERIKKYEGMYKIISKKSDDAINDIEDNELDLVYIDGNHDTPFVARDIVNYWNKLKSGGYLTGDDWGMSSVISGILLGFSQIGSKQNLNQFNIIYWGRNWIVKKP